jgi:hypothetical protein
MYEDLMQVDFIGAGKEAGKVGRPKKKSTKVGAVQGKAKSSSKKGKGSKKTKSRSRKKGDRLTFKKAIVEIAAIAAGAVIADLAIDQVMKATTPPDERLVEGIGIVAGAYGSTKLRSKMLKRVAQGVAVGSGVRLVERVIDDAAVGKTSGSIDQYLHSSQKNVIPFTRQDYKRLQSGEL